MSEISSVESLPFTGERFTPECVREIWYEHWHRYAFAQMFARDKRVLDAACGEGYGSALLAGVAQSVLGIDISDSAIVHARSRYGQRTNLEFERDDVTALKLPAASIDLITSFETLEHLVAQDTLLAGFAQVLRPDGILLISSPDKATYSDASGFHNEFHVRELYRDELLALLGQYFPHVHLYGQKLLFQSALWPLQAQNGLTQTVTATNQDGEMAERLSYAPLYYLAVCSHQPLKQPLPNLSLFGDSDESVYRHYNSEIRKTIAAGGRIAELEAQVSTLRRERDGLAEQLVEVKSREQTSKPLPWWRRILLRTPNNPDPH